MGVGVVLVLAASVECFWSLPLEEQWEVEQEEAAAGDTCGGEDEPGSAGGEDGGEVWDRPFFSEE